MLIPLINNSISLFSSWIKDVQKRRCDLRYVIEVCEWKMVVEVSDDGSFAAEVGASD
jgi:hypothetical protein